MDAATNPEAPIRVFWAPACTSCLRAKEFLARHAIPFESVNVRAMPGAMDALYALGARSVPVVARGDRYVYAQSLADVKAFLGLDVAIDEPLPPAVLATRVDTVLAKTIGFLHQIPGAVLDAPFRNSWAPPRGLAHHVVRIVEAFLEAVEAPRELSYELIMAGTHAVVPGQDIAGYADAVRRRFAAWWAAHRDRSFATNVATYYGDQTLHEALERTTWHAAQHARQLMVVIESLGAPVTTPLTAADLAGLPLPAKAWDDDR